MPIFSKGDRNILFLHIPKCGGSSVTEAFQKMGYNVLLHMGGLPIQKPLTASPQHLTLEQLRPLLATSEIQEIFTIVRNPYARMLSEYRWVTRNIKDPRLLPPLGSWLEEVISRAKEDPCHADNHIRPMIDFLSPGIPCRIFKYESGLNVVTEFYCPKDVLETPPMGDSNRASQFTSPARAPSSLPDSPEHLSVDSLELISNYYADDFAAFCYPILKSQKDKQSLCDPSPQKADGTGLCQEIANTLALSNQECISSLASKLASLRSSSKAIRKQDIDHFATQLASQQDKHTADIQSKLQQANEARLESEQTLEELRTTLEEQVNEARLESDQTFEQLRTTLEELEKYYLLSNKRQHNLEKALKKLSLNRDQLKFSITVIRSCLEAQQRAFMLLNRLTLVLPLTFEAAASEGRQEMQKLIFGNRITRWFYTPVKKAFRSTNTT
jgi:hypothetical protein